MERTKYFFSTQKGKITLSAIISFFVAILLMLAIFLPIVFNGQNLYGTPVIAYNRDANSGTRVAFEESINFNDERQTYSSNVLQVSGNDDMLKKVETSTNSIGYVSLFSALDKDSEGNYVALDGIDILQFNGTEPIGDISNSMDHYDAKRYFNLFFRVDEKYNDLLAANMFDSGSNNAFYAGGNVVGDSALISEFRNDYNLTSNQDFLNFYSAFLYYNWLFFSPDAKASLDLSIAEVNSDFNNALQIFLTNVNFNDLTNGGALIPIIYTVGSNSVTSSINHTRESFVSLFDANNRPQFEALNDGSSDAFKDDNQIQPGFDHHFWLGFQSRSPKSEEMKLFNQSFTGTEGNYNIATNLTFFSFEIDAIAFIVSDDNTFTSNGKNLKITDIESVGINLIYTQGVSFEFLYEAELLEAIEV